MFPWNPFADIIFHTNRHLHFAIWQQKILLWDEWKQNRCELLEIVTADSIYLFSLNKFMVWNSIKTWNNIFFPENWLQSYNLFKLRRVKLKHTKISFFQSWCMHWLESWFLHKNRIGSIEHCICTFKISSHSWIAWAIVSMVERIMNLWLELNKVPVKMMKFTHLCCS